MTKGIIEEWAKENGYFIDSPTMRDLKTRIEKAIDEIKKVNEIVFTRNNWSMIGFIPVDELKDALLGEEEIKHGTQKNA